MLEGYEYQWLTGLWITFKVAFGALLLGLSLGVLGAAAKASSYRWLARSVSVMINLIRGLPELLVLFFVYYGSIIILSYLFDQYIEVSAFTASIISLGLIFGAYATETIRSAYNAIPRGQWEAAIAYGFSSPLAWIRIILPQLWLHALPGLSNLWMVLLKDTALVALIGLPDTMRVAQNVSAATQQPFKVYLIAGLIYLGLTSLSLIGQQTIKRYLARHQLGTL